MKFPFRLGMIPTLAVVIASFVIWAGLFEIDQTVHATGLVVPDARTQVIQAVDGGVLADIRVHEGQPVKSGQVLAVLESNRARAAYDESRAKNMAINAARIRARAESLGQPPSFGKAFAGYPELVMAQQQLYAQRRKSLDESVAMVRESLELASDELRMNEALYDQGDSSRVELLRARRQVSEVKARLTEIRNKYLQEAHAEAAKQEEEFSTSRYRTDERRDVLGHTELTSPAAGIVKYLRVTTVGGVLRTGDELMQISPTDGEPFVEVRIAPADIGVLRTGLPVSVRFDAFDYTVYGSVAGELVYLSSDTLTENGADGRAQTYYRGRIRVDSARGITLKPGMTASADIRTGHRSVLQYLMNPITRGFTGALSER